MKNIVRNWKTTSAGIISIATGISIYVSDNSKMLEALSFILTGVGLILAKDNDQTGLANKDEIGGGTAGTIKP